MAQQRMYAIVNLSHFSPSFSALTDTIEDAKSLAANGLTVLWQARYIAGFKYLSQPQSNKTEWRISYYIKIADTEKIGFLRVNLPRELKHYFLNGKYFFEEEITLALEKLIESRSTAVQ